MDLAAFRIRFPEFAKVGDPLVSAVLAEAALEMSPDIWGTKYDTGHGQLTAHKLAISPLGQAARLSSDKGMSTYGTEYQRLVIQVAGMSLRVV